jgi:hypothetical protein
VSRLDGAGDEMRLEMPAESCCGVEAHVGVVVLGKRASSERALARQEARAKKNG